MTTTRDILDRAKLDSQREEAIEKLKKEYACNMCGTQGVNTIKGECPRCGDSKIDPDQRKEYNRKLKDIEDRYGR